MFVRQENKRHYRLATVVRRRLLRAGSEIVKPIKSNALSNSFNVGFTPSESVKTPFDEVF